MSTKAKKTATKPKNEKPMKAEKTAKAKAAKSEIIEETVNLEAAADDAEELEEAEEAAAAEKSRGTSGNAAALAAATAGSTETSASFKNFRHHPDMENFYRFIYENDLRLEALTIIDEMVLERANRKAVKAAKANAH